MWSCYVIFTHHGKKFKNGRIFNRFQRGTKITGLFQNPGHITSADGMQITEFYLVFDHNRLMSE